MNSHFVWRQSVLEVGTQMFPGVSFLLTESHLNPVTVSPLRDSELLWGERLGLMREGHSLRVCPKISPVIHILAAAI